ncbi:hypothetical protein CSA37_13045 [Candidatus Fermentibacteria bacterium]|nr:MAG: hypothetical protein CSA37_13045 [Candidatus Fermentibacteria bacterium]
MANVLLYIPGPADRILLFHLHGNIQSLLQGYRLQAALGIQTYGQDMLPETTVTHRKFLLAHLQLFLS